MFSVMFDWISKYISPVSVNNIIDSVPKELDDISKGWELLLNETEKYLQDKSNEVQEELKILRRMTNTVALRPLINSRIASYYASIDRETTAILVNSRLDSSIRQGILRTFLTTSNEGYNLKVQNQWQQLIIQIICNHCLVKELLKSDINVIVERVKELRVNWVEEKYQKNICGDILSLTFQASAPTQQFGLTSKILSDIIWTIYLSLSRVISINLERPLFPSEINILIDMLLEQVSIIVDLWLQSSKINRNINNRMGKLPSCWQKENSDRLLKIKEIKENGADAKFSDGPSDDLWQKHLQMVKENEQQSTNHLIEPDDFNTRRQKLMSGLIFYSKKIK